MLTGLTIAPDDAQSDDVFTIGHARGMQDDTFGAFSDFVTQLATDLADGSTAVIAVTASGRFDASSSTFTATHVVVLLTH